MKIKTIITKLSILLAIVFLTGCGLANNHVTVFYTMKMNFMPHPYKVKKEGENSFPQNGTGIVSLNFKTENNDSVGTLWRRINSNGSFSDRISLTYFDMYKKGRLESMIEPGIYFLDGLKYVHNNHLITLGAFQALMYANTQRGWDIEKKQPLWFSFEVKKGEEIFVPDVTLSYNCKDYTCNNESFLIQMSVDNPDKKQAKFYKIGYKTNLK